jgi:Prokaryotic membrane lipoprotein lipid attachment site
MRQILLATFALLLLSGCKTSGYNPLKIEHQQGWHLAAGIERLLTSLIGR